MIVCICNNVSEDEISTCINEGQTLDECVLRLHLGEYCQKCLDVLPKLFPEEDSKE